jgi:hypothetical protein
MSLKEYIELFMSESVQKGKQEGSLESVRDRSTNSKFFKKPKEIRSSLFPDSAFG